MSDLDLQKTQILYDLFQVPKDQREDDWVAQFLAAAPEASMAAGDPQVLVGPDGFPYFALHTPPAGEAFHAFSVNHILPYVLKDGVGIVFNPESGPDYVFSYGMLWSLKEFGGVDGDPADEKAGKVPKKVHIAEQEEEVLVAQPSATYFPPYARQVVRKFFEQNGFEDPKMFMLIHPKMTPSRTLVFNVFREDFETQEEFDDFYSRLPWYFPARYSATVLDQTQNPDFMTRFAPI